MTQTDFDLALSMPVSRLTDPEASGLAGAAITASGERVGQLRAVLALVTRYPGSTSLELARAAGMDRYVVARRLPELEHGGIVVKGEQRVCREGKRLATTWRLA